MKNRSDIAALITRTLSEPPYSLERNQVEILKLVELPKDRKLGDWAFPCFSLAKELKKAPPAIAAELADLLSPHLKTLPAISAVKATGPYLNFFVSKSALAAEIIPQILDGSYLARRAATGTRMMIEYSQPNTHKAVHVGHIRCAALGDTVIRIFEWLGNEVIAANYIGDEGTHVAKCLWYYTQLFKGEIPKTHRGEFLGKLYTIATDLLDLSTMTRAPYPGVVSAKVLEIAEHAKEKKWIVVKVDLGDTTKQIITAAHNFAVGDIVPYARPGIDVADKSVGNIEKLGVGSEGMLCSEFELGLSDITDKIHILPPSTKIGIEIAEIYKTCDVPSVLEEIKRRAQEVSKVLQAIESGEPKMKATWAETKKWSMDELYDVYKWLDCRFDHYFFESEFGHAGKEIVTEFQKKGVFVESHGAVGADLNQFGLGFIILIKRDGTATYATRDLALARKKFEDYKVDRSLYVVDSAQSLHFKQVFKCLELMQFPQAKLCHHLGYAQVVRPDGKMSSRKGNVILFSELKDRLLQKINSEFLNKYRGEWPDQEIDTAAHLIALATMRYGMLTQDNNSLVVFDLDEWSSRSGNTGPYLLYAYARIQSILREAGEVLPSEVNWGDLAHESEVDLVLHLNTYHEVLRDVGTNYSPHRLCAYLYELSKKFSTMYNACSVLNAETAQLRKARTCLVKAVGLVLQHGLQLLGIKVVPRM